MHTGIPVFARPFRVDPGHGEPYTYEQDTEEEIMQSVAVLVETPVGSRIEMLDYGVPEMLFKLDIDRSAVAAAIAAHEPRGTALVDDSVDTLDDLIRNVKIQMGSNDG